MYSQKIAGVVSSFLKRAQLKTGFDKEEGYFYFMSDLKCNLRNCVLMVSIGESWVSFNSFCNLDPEILTNRLDVAEYLTRVNERLSLGFLMYSFEKRRVYYQYIYD